MLWPQEIYVSWALVQKTKHKSRRPNITKNLGIFQIPLVVNLDLKVSDTLSI